MADCVFCKIANGDIKARLVRETPELVAFLDLNPQAPTHILIVPRKHIDGLSKCTAEDEALLGKIQLMAAELAAELGLSTGYRLVTNNGRWAGQSVDHLHYHLLGGRRLGWPPG